MNVIRKAVSALGGIFLAALLVAALAPKATRGIAAALVQLVPGTTTHVGQNESQLVALNCAMGNNFCNAIDPQGVVDTTTAYVVPAGYTLIVTDYEWTRFIITDLEPGELLFNSLISVPSGPGISIHTIVNSTAVTANVGGAAIHDRFVTGVRIGSGVKLADVQAINNLGWAYVQGYLVPND